jgi:hypothetical protein
MDLESALLVTARTAQTSGLVVDDSIVFRRRSLTFCLTLTYMDLDQPCSIRKLLIYCNYLSSLTHLSTSSASL